MVSGVFQNVAQSYDIMNDLMSGGMHRIWKDYFIEKLVPIEHKGSEKKIRILDVAGGTGDIAFRITDSLNNEDTERNEFKKELMTEVVICDINPAMLKVGQERSIQRHDSRYSRIRWIEGDAENLPFESNSFDAYTIAFGIRNVTNIDKALNEAYRVLKKGGRFMCLEFSHVENTLLKNLYDLYSFNVIPTLGQVIAQDRASYQYLIESIRQFPDQEKFKTMIENSGFKLVTYENLTNGIVSIHSGFKL